MSVEHFYFVSVLSCSHALFPQTVDPSVMLLLKSVTLTSTYIFEAVWRRWRVLRTIQHYVHRTTSLQAVTMSVCQSLSGQWLTLIGTVVITHLELVDCPRHQCSASLRHRCHVTPWRHPSPTSQPPEPHHYSWDAPVPRTPAGTCCNWHVNRPGYDPAHDNKDEYMLNIPTVSKRSWSPYALPDLWLQYQLNII